MRLPDPDDLLTLTLPREVWELILEDALTFPGTEPGDRLAELCALVYRLHEEFPLNAPAGAAVSDADLPAHGMAVLAEALCQQVKQLVEADYMRVAAAVDKHFPKAGDTPLN